MDEQQIRKELEQTHGSVAYFAGRLAEAEDALLTAEARTLLGEGEQDEVASLQADRDRLSGRLAEVQHLEVVTVRAVEILDARKPGAGGPGPTRRGGRQ